MMKEGFYEKLLTESIAEALGKESDKTIIREPFSKSDGSIFLLRYFQQVLQQAYNQIMEARDELAKNKLIEFTNELIKLTARFLDDKEFEQGLIAAQGEILKAFFHSATYAEENLKKNLQDYFPITGLSESALFNGSKHTPSLESELKKEMLTSDEIWWLVSFLKFEGVRLFEQVFRKLAESGKKVKIISTVYMGATDLKAIDFLSGFSNVDVKISFNTNQERLHAKSYLFLRDSGFHTAYIGSSNLSRSALTSGLEWNLKVTQQEIPHIIAKCRHTFETYWNNPNFIMYNALSDRQKLQNALQSGRAPAFNDDISQFFDLAPFPFQQQILDQLVQCREKGEMKNLIVAATGTGKTIISAFDFKRFIRQNPHGKFLFVAHREEILRQARYTYRQVLKNNDFGQFWFNGERPERYNQLFVSIQTLNNRIEDLSWSSDFFDYIVIDEVHHSAAKSYRLLLSRFTPKILLGLTATPERHDGDDVTRYFGNTLSAELRLSDALNQGLLCPFQYFGITDQSDLSSVSWRKGRYEISALEKVYNEDYRRVTDIIRNCHKYLKDIKDVRALCFCVSMNHEEFMAKAFNEKGLRAAYLHSGNSHCRIELIDQLRRKEINYLFVVDIFNEGVDIPEIDTLLFLRPTESLTIYLQQLGRGLRLHEDKTCLTVLDFVGQQHEEYSFEHKFRAMLGKTHTRVKDELNKGFPNLPLGCSITLEETARDIILRKIHNTYSGTESSLLRAINRFKNDYDKELTLRNFCELMGIDLFTVYKNKKLLFFELKAKSEQEFFQRHEYSGHLAKAMGSTWLATESESYFEFITSFVLGKELNMAHALTEQYLIMLYMDLFDRASGAESATELYQLLLKVFDHDELRKEVKDYMQIRLSQLESIEKPIDLKVPSVLRLQGRYTRSQILSGVSVNTLNHRTVSQSGVHRITSAGKEMELLFVTLNKDEDRFSSSTMYQDYFISSKLFHWQSQNTTTPESNAGKGYIHQEENGRDILLFVREATTDHNGVTMAYVFCGKLFYSTHEGRRPMSIIWRMENTPPALLFNEGHKLAVG